MALLGALRRRLIQLAPGRTPPEPPTEEVATDETRLLDMHNDLNTVSGMLLCSSAWWALTLQPHRDLLCFRTIEEAHPG